MYYYDVVCLYTTRLINGSLLYEKIKKIEYKGAVEAIAMSKVIRLIICRGILLFLSILLY